MTLLSENHFTQGCLSHLPLNTCKFSSWVKGPQGRKRPHSSSHCFVTLMWGGVGGRAPPQESLAPPPSRINFRKSTPHPHPPYRFRRPPESQTTGTQEQNPEENSRANPQGGPSSSKTLIADSGPFPSLAGCSSGRGWRQGRTCDEVAELSVEAHVVVGAVQPDHPEFPRHVLGHGDVVRGRVEGGCLIIHIQHCGQSRWSGLGLASALNSQLQRQWLKPQTNRKHIS